MAEAWIESLAAGDEVIVDESRYGAFAWRLTSVARLTRTQVLVADVYRGNGERYERRFHKSNGQEVGGSYSAWSSPALLRQPTPEARERIANHNRRQSALGVVTKQNWHKLDTDTLECIASVIAAASKEQA